MQGKKEEFQNNLSFWDDVWRDSAGDRNRAEFYEWVKRDKCGVRGTKIQQYISERFGRIEGVKTIEVGSGLGTFSYILSCLGARVTLLDSSRHAIHTAKDIYEKDHIAATFLTGDAFCLDEKLAGQYDVAMSFGTVEHFRYPERLEIIRAHAKLVRKNGAVIISVPNKMFLPHEMLKAYLNARKKWQLGYEGAFTRAELFRVAKELELTDVQIIGSAFLTDFARYFRIYRSTRLAEKLFGKTSKKDIVKDQASWLDDYLGADIVLMGIKR